MAGERGTGGPKGGAGAAGAGTHRWAVDRIEEGTAAVEEDGDHVYEVPRYLLPADARDGDVMSVSVVQGAAGEATISVRIDRGAAPSPLKPARKKRRAGNDPGGDIVL